MRSFRVVAATIAAVMVAAVAGAQQSQTTYHVTRTFKLGGQGRWDYIHAEAAAHRLYISRSDHVQVLDTRTGKVIGEIPGTAGVHGIAIAPKLHRGFTSNGGSGTVTIFDTRSLKVIGTVKVDQGPDCIIFDPATNRVFTFNGRAETATAIDAATGTVAGSIPLGGRPEYAIADGRGMVYDNLEDKSEIVAIDAQKLTIAHTWPIAPGQEASGIAMDRQNRRLFAVCRNKMMVVMDADTGAVLATPAIGSGPDAAGFDPGAELAFSSNGGSGTLTLIHEDSNSAFSVVADVPTAPGARTMALDTKTHHVFLATARFQPASAGEPPWRRQMVPNSFEIIEVSP
ncbi:MAG: YncE family protein [Armatimonadetes bacterium]|nr:YncE family protein [Armatimonadota bacterium]MDE2205444.1 YncE family protein [Armatimonadota bacterium]